MLRRRCAVGITFNADEVLGMAEQIERNGQAFYRRAAEITADAGVKKLMLDLADWEGRHEKLFVGMRARLTDEERTMTAADPEGESELYVRAMADTHVFKLQNPTGLLSDADSLGKVLHTALAFERDSILFFLGMKAMVPARLGAGKVDEIVKEEIRHVAFLKKQLDAVES